VEVEIGNESRRDDTGFHTQALPPDEGLASTGLPPQPVGATAPAVLLETPLVRAQVGSALRLGIRAGDILLATFPPQGLSARNVIPGRIASLAQHDVIVMARVRCGGTNSGVEMEVRLTLAARDSLQLAPGKEVWLVIKTHSCHLMQR
jgi:molybdopterin-binding protein